MVSMKYYLHSKRELIDFSVEGKTTQRGQTQGEDIRLMCKESVVIDIPK